MSERIEHTALVSSAGAGKTRALTKRFLYLYLHKANFKLKSLYGITFTNEAAFEMKTRVLNYLDLIAIGVSTDPSEREIIEHFSSCFSDARERAKKRKKHLLNNLTDLNIYTFHSLFASFLSSIPFAAGVLPGYRIIDEAAESIIYEKILDRYFESSRREKNQFELMKRFVQQNEVRIKKNLRSIYQSIMPWIDFLNDLIDNENALKTGVNTTKAGFVESLRQFIAFIQKHEKAAYTKSKERMNKDMLGLCRTIDEYLESGDFSILEKSEYTKAVLRGDITEKKYLIKFADNLNSVKKDFEKLLKMLSSKTRDHLRALSDQQISMYLKPILEIHNIFQEEKRARNLVSFDDIEMLTLRALRMNSDLEYLYFKIGAEIAHLMIDEFQDTSYQQLEIIDPLISEILSIDPSEKSLFYVGDPKQAIYRWRGGASELFNVLIDRYPKKIRREELATNYRSKAEIIDFVNTVLEKDDKAEEGNTGGWIRVENIGDYADAEQGSQAVMERSCAIIKELKENYCYKYSDIAVLVRTNRFGAMLAESMSDANIPHVSSSKCDILSDIDVRIILKVLQFLDDPQNDFALLHVLLSPYFDMDEEILRRLRHPGRTLFLSLRDSHPGWPATKKLVKLLNMVHFMNPYDLIFNIYQEFQVNITYALATLLDIALDYVIEDSGHLSAFLDWLEDVGETIHIKEIHPEGVQVLTAHKAKGLEFDIVLLPETDWTIRKGEDPQLLFSYKENGIEPEGVYWRGYGKYLPDLKDAEQERLQNDELNLLYVALTRARYGIHVIGFQQRKKRLGFWFERIVDKVDGFSYSRGEIIKKKEEGALKTETQKYSATKREPSALKEERSLYSPTERALELVGVSRRRSMEFGTMVHQALSNIVWLDDIDLQPFIEDLLCRIQARYLRVYDEESDIEQKLSPILIETLTDPDLRSFFFKNGRIAECKNEVAIYFEEKDKDVSGQIDRLIIDAEEVTIIDYKTGEVEDKHKQQLMTYKKGVRKIYDQKRVRAMLVYLDKIRGEKVVSV